MFFPFNGANLSLLGFLKSFLNYDDCEPMVSYKRVSYNKSKWNQFFRYTRFFNMKYWKALTFSI